MSAAANSKPTLTYFDLRGRAELPRLLLAAAGVDYVDDRIAFELKPGGPPFQGDWPERKPKQPWLQVPVFTVNGVPIAQSASITRYIARAHGLEGDSPLDIALVDGFFEAIVELRTAYFNNKSDQAKTAEYWEKNFPAGVDLLNKNIRGASSVQPSGKLTYADVALYYVFWSLGTENKSAVDAAVAKNSKVAAVIDSVSNNAKIKTYLATRKVTPF